MRKTALLLTSLASLAAALAVAHAQITQTYLASLKPMAKGPGTDWISFSATVDGKQYAESLVTTFLYREGVPENWVAYDIGGAYERFVAWVGVSDKEVNPDLAVTFKVIVDGELGFASPPMRKGEPARMVNVLIGQARELRLEIHSDIPKGSAFEAVWGNPMLVPKEPAQPTVNPVTPKPNPKPDPTPAPKTRTYVVKKGDTAWDIAHRAGFSLGGLQRLNPGRDLSLIKPGDVLSLGPKPASTPPKATGTQPPTPPPPPPIKVLVNGKPAQVKVEVIDNRVYVPVRAIGDAVGAVVEYDPAERVVRITKPGAK